MSKIKDSVKKITPFVKPYKFGFLTAILLIVIAAVFSAIAPRTEGLVLYVFLFQLHFLHLKL